jgi:hypothetical protein
MAGDPGVDPTTCGAAEWLALEIADAAADAARREAETMALLAALGHRTDSDLDDLARRDEATAAALEQAIEQRVRQTRLHFPAPRRGWLADEIAKRERRP